MQAGRDRRAGFTLIELLVVVAILGVLAAIAIPAFSGRQAKAYDARVVHDARAAASAQEAYFVDNQTYLAGDCGVLPGFEASAGVACVADGDDGRFSITTSHLKASKNCVWSSDATPNLSCTTS